MLDLLGYHPFFEAQMSELAPHLKIGRIVGQHRRQWDVAMTDGVRRAFLAGRSWAQEHVTQLDDAQPAVGDWVALQYQEQGDEAVIVKVLKRRSELSRTSVARRGARQTLVANIDVVGVVAAFTQETATDSVARRSLNARRIERYVAAIVSGGAEPVVLINKSDLVESSAEQTEALSQRLSGVPVLPVCALKAGGLDQFTTRLQRGQTIALVGPSGVGKSSIINQLLGRNAQRVHSERDQDARGRHTTTHRELFVSDDGFCLIDTPGMREFALSESAASDLSSFSDLVELAKACQFRDCSHQREPGCAVRKAVDEGKLNADRAESYLVLAREADTIRKVPVRRRLVGGKGRSRTESRKKNWQEGE